MKKKSGFLLITGIVFLILCITIFVVLYWFIMRPMPRMNGIIKFPGLKDKVNRDECWQDPRLSVIVHLFSSLLRWTMLDPSKTGWCGGDLERTLLAFYDLKCAELLE